MKNGLTDQLRRCLKRSPVSRYRISLDSKGVLSQTELSGFVRGQRNLGAAKLDCLSKLLGVKIVGVNEKTASA